MPGLDGANRGAGSGRSGGVTGGVSLGGGGDDDDDSEDDDDDPRNEGLEDDDDGSLNDDELMKEYMREMVKDGTAEDALGAWARDAARAAKEARENTAKGGKSGDKVDDSKSPSRRWMPGFLRRRFDEKDTYQQLDISPAAHAGLVFAATAYYAWNVSRSVCGDALDRAFLKTNFGRWTLVIDTPLADAMEQIEIGSFEGVCCAAVAEGAIGDVGALTSGRRVDDGRHAARRSRRNRRRRGGRARAGPAGRAGGRAEQAEGEGGGRRGGSIGPEPKKRRLEPEGRLRLRLGAERRGCFSAANASRWPPARRACAAPNPLSRRETS
jgi:hypothetical protein